MALDELVLWSATANSAAPVTRLGLNATGGEATDESDPDEVLMVGGAADQVPGLISYSGNARFHPTDETLTNLIFRATSGYPASALTAFAMGYVKGSSVAAYHNCKVSSATFEAEVGGPLVCEINWLALDKAVGSAGTAASVSGTSWKWYQAGSTILGGDWRCQRFSINIDNNLEPEADLDGTMTSGNKRNPTRLNEGDEIVTLEITTRTPIPDSTLLHLADDQTTVGDATFTFTRGTSTMVLDLQDLMPTGKAEIAQAEAGQTEYTYRFRLARNSGGFTVNYTA